MRASVFVVHNPFPFGGELGIASASVRRASASIPLWAARPLAFRKIPSQARVVASHALK